MIPSNVVVPVTVTGPVNDGLIRGAFKAMLLVIAVAKFGSSPRAAASSFSVSNVAGAVSTRLASAVVVNSVVAICVVLVPAAAVGAVGTPDRVNPAKVGLAVVATP